MASPTTPLSPGSRLPQPQPSLGPIDLVAEGTDPAEYDQLQPEKPTIKQQGVQHQTFKRRRQNADIESGDTGDMLNRVRMTLTPPTSPATSSEGPVEDNELGQDAGDMEDEDENRETVQEIYEETRQLTDSIVVNLVPRQPPTEAFKGPPPAKDSSWTQTEHAPTLQYANQDICPIDWEFIKARSTGLNDINIQSYELRKPWIPKSRGGELGFEKMVGKIHEPGDTSVQTLESARKRFNKANLIVFEVTGVYFEGFTASLKENKAFATTKAAEMLGYGINDKSEPNDDSEGDSDSMPDCSFEGDHSDEGCAQALATQHAPFGCHIHEPLERQFVETEKLEAIRISESLLDKTYLLDVSAKAFDIFTVVLLTAFDDDDDHIEYTQARYEDAGKGTSFHNLFETYCLSQPLETPVVSDMILERLRLIFNDSETSLHLFQPKSLRYLFAHTDASDPIRLLIIDVFQTDVHAADSRADLYGRQTYPEALLRYWDHWKHQQQKIIRPKDQRLNDQCPTETYTGRRKAQDGLIGVLSKAPDV
ncbi:hypothetical protein BU23DRAFT_562649 [Bimuria novae-zelandiae CBS 107.79]|uniref:Uncharacterized protein n=1 Tax=Bimuria novae-zelandiae CBS 107.79 TaxID=1447943 RepID=A0A6A5VSN1_9PLEO|nr:hypothetical protein BU23DRAFT_562649 [Bimuria novae-zelandiae CBS 107.79]